MKKKDWTIQTIIGAVVVVLLFVMGFRLGLFSISGDQFLFVNQEGSPTFNAGDDVFFEEISIHPKESLYVLYVDGVPCRRDKESMIYHELTNPDVPTWSCYRVSSELPTSSCILTEGFHTLKIKWKQGNPGGLANCNYDPNAGNGNLPLKNPTPDETWVKGGFTAPNSPRGWYTFEKRVYVYPNEPNCYVLENNECVFKYVSSCGSLPNTYETLSYCQKYINGQKQVCSNGDIKEYACPDSSKIDYCECANGLWKCIDSPLNKCIEGEEIDEEQKTNPLFIIGIVVFIIGLLAVLVWQIRKR